MTDNGVDTLFTYNPIGFNGGTGLAEEGAGVSLPARTRAIEMYGVAAHRLFYTVGVVSPDRAGEARTASSATTAARISTPASTTSSEAWGSTGTRPA